MSYAQRPVVIPWGVKVIQRFLNVFIYLFILSNFCLFFLPFFLWMQYAVFCYLITIYSISYMRFWFKSTKAFLCLSIKIVRINTYCCIQDYFFLRLTGYHNNLFSPIKIPYEGIYKPCNFPIIAIIYKIDFTPSYRQLQESYWRSSLLQWTNPPQ